MLPCEAGKTAVLYALLCPALCQPKKDMPPSSSSDTIASSDVLDNELYSYLHTYRIITDNSNELAVLAIHQTAVRIDATTFNTA